MIYDMMYHDGVNYKQSFRAEISPEIFAKNDIDQNVILSGSEPMIEMEESGMTVEEFFKQMSWSYDPDYDHNLLSIQNVSDNQIMEPEAYFITEERRKEIITKKALETTKDFGEDDFHAAVDVPPHVANKAGEWGEWVNLEQFKTKEQAIAWAREHLNADENGKICVISTF